MEMAVWFAAFGLVAFGATTLLKFIVSIGMWRRYQGWRCDKCRPKVTCIGCGAAAPEIDLGDLRPAPKFPRGQSKIIEDCDDV